DLHRRNDFVRPLGEDHEAFVDATFASRIVEVLDALLVQRPAVVVALEGDDGALPLHLVVIEAIRDGTCLLLVTTSKPAPARVGEEGVETRGTVPVFGHCRL